MPNLVLYMVRIWVPDTAKEEIMMKLHLPHMGENKKLALARSLYFWPKMDKDLKRLV